MTPDTIDCSAHAELLIAKSGFIGRRILQLYRFMRQEPSCRQPEAGLKGYWLRQQKLRRLLSAAGISYLADFLYTFYVGGSLTGQDQLTFARLQGSPERAHRLTAVNALAFGIPTALFYFVAGEGFHLLSSVHSYAELPALIFGHTVLASGLLSLCVDLFRAADALINKRCWAPFGLFPFIINIPTYLNRIAAELPPPVRRTLMSAPAVNGPVGKSTVTRRYPTD